MNYTERNKLLDKISLIGLMAIFVELFLYAVDHCFTERFDVAANMPVVMNIFGLIYLLVSIGLFFYAKKKGKKELFIFAIEFLVLAFLCPFITYWYYPKFFGLTTNWLHKIDHRLLWLAIFIYYVIRVIYATIYAIRNSNASKLKRKKAKA